MNDWDWFETLKTQLLGKLIWMLFLLWKWIKYTFLLFVLKSCLELGVLLWNQLELLYSLRKEIVAGPPFCKIFIIHPRKKFLKSKWCRIWFKYRSCSSTFFVFLSNTQKMYIGPYSSSPSPSKFMYIDIFWTLNIFTKSHDNYHGYL